jgi:hypothetical protein
LLPPGTEGGAVVVVLVVDVVSGPDGVAEGDGLEPVVVAGGGAPAKFIPTATPGNPMVEYNSGAAVWSRCIPSWICMMACKASGLDIRPCKHIKFKFLLVNNCLGSTIQSLGSMIQSLGSTTQSLDSLP